MSESLRQLLRAATLVLAILALWSTTPTLAQPPMTISVTNRDRDPINVICGHKVSQGQMLTIAPGQVDQVIPVPPLGSGGLCRGMFQNACTSVLYSEERGDAALCSQKGISILADASGFQRKYLELPAWEHLKAECPFDNDYGK